jgi:AcrR family transcriptional regulator
MPRSESRAPEDARGHLSERRRRADTECSIAAIVEAAFDCLCEDPGVTMSAIARAAGVGRVTLYAHFPTRKALVDAVARRGGTRRGSREGGAGAPGRSGLASPRPLLAPGRRDRSRPGPARHREVQDLLLDRVERLIVRGQDEGAFRVDVPPPLHVLTGWNPGARSRSVAENERLNQRLWERLQAAGTVTETALGWLGSWSEPSFVVSGLPIAGAVELAREFGQVAIFEITQSELRVIDCANGQGRGQRARR